ncbi:MAG: 3-hydroxyacyl-ACP dehydratase FabZ [Pseudomonadota bacterium]|nr:3-hydroxyacyl-ACP dehydratase FabZ [Gammaproteobacteria bacterium]MBU1559129.1 3-hydroxyacyl-ACP dehydratase FabZ [Gammaproteobacteria bacterium]MBU1628910.1 3-hydroxyacyl-ACP dehydratase FabZ [Gammaproteobacteria bacterium]MBU1926965.1 3-hydroxyacyl-ACP dehydratase FabZ [Gammaproteobacteria bacterium]MBU2546603.1 3-hydroxyacyl-ACP dehydratase FabZ [Gammaproteobacteria bacterium]
MTNTVIGIEEILNRLPHRPPFLLIDRIIELIPGESLVAIKNVTINEPFFVGHFPQKPIMPGVLILEALAQASTVLAFITMDETQDSDVLYYFAGIDNARFKRMVVPGDQLRLEVKLKRARKRIWTIEAIAKVDNEVVCTADLMSARSSKIPQE